MAERFVRIDLSEEARDFRPVVLEPGFPMLDKSDANAKVVCNWLGRFAAEPVSDGDSVSFYVRDDQGGRLESVTCWPASAKKLKGELRPELDALEQRVRKVKPRSRDEKMIHKTLVDTFDRFVADPNCSDRNCYLFEYHDAQRQPRLVWGWGYQRVDRDPAAAMLCSNGKCNLLSVTPGKSSPKCPGCQRAPILKRRVRPRTAMLAVFLGAVMLAGLAGAAWYWLYVRPTAVLAGRVTSAVDKEPIDGAELRITGTDYRIRTDGQGEFRIEKMPEGRFELRVIAGHFDTKVVAAELMRAEETWMDIALEGGPCPRGRVMDAQTGEPVFGAEVAVKESDCNPLLTDEDGAFQFPGITSEPMTISVQARGYGDAEVEWQPQSDPIEIMLTGNAALQGRVVSAATGDPVPSATVRRKGSESGIQTDGRGQFRLGNLPGGDVEFEVDADGFSPGTFAAGLEPGEMLTLPEDVRLGGEAGLVVRIIDAATGAPIPDGVVLVGSSGQLTVQADSDGRWPIHQLPFGLTPLEMSAVGYTGVTRSVELRSGEVRWAGDGTNQWQPQSQTLEAMLTGNAGLQGRVVSVTGDPVPGASVGREGCDSRVLTDESGRFRIDELPGRSVNIGVEAAGFPSGTFFVDLEPGEVLTSPEDFRLSGDAVLLVRATDAATMAPVPDAVVAVGDSGRMTVHTDNDGRCVIPDLPAGVTPLNVSARGYSAVSRSVELGPGEKEVAIELEGSSTLIVTVRQLIGRTPAKGATVRLAVSSLADRTDDHGQVRFVNVRGGPARVVASMGDLSDEKEITLEDGENELEIVLGRNTGVTGRVADGTTGDNISGAVVSVEVGGDRLGAKTGSDGTWHVEGPFAGPAKIRFAALGYNDSPPIEVDLPPQKKTDIGEVKLQGNATVVVQIVGPDGKTPFRGATVRIAGTAYAAKTNEKGIATITNVPSILGQTLEILGQDCTPVRLPLELVANKTTTVPPVRLASSIVLSGTVINALDNKPVANARVQVEGTDLVARTDAYGGFEIQGVPPGPLTLIITGEGIREEKVLVNSDPQRTDSGAPRKTVRTVVSPKLPPGQVRIVLTWGWSPRDLDAHLYGPLAGGRRFHISHENRQDTAVTPSVKLDIDDRDGSGPETITIRKLVPNGEYEYLVHHYRGKDSGPGTLAQSGAEVKVYAEDKTYAFTVKEDTGDSTLWRAFTIEVDRSGKPTVYRPGKGDTRTYQKGTPPD